MLYSVTVALDQRTVGTLLMGESGIQGLTIRSYSSALDSSTLELDRAAVLELALLLDMAQEATQRDAVLSAQMEYVLRDTEGVLKARQSQSQLPF